ncbi:MAG: hypothetical protein JO199_02945, partial [Candidatus Eremiobacteraeota bacterium]|nr:hypothetical protein [Candidatus Eremiobacteraeota bacterium]
GHATTFVAGFYTPPYPVFDNGQYLTIRFDGDGHTFVKHVAAEQSAIHLPLPAQLQGLRGVVRVRIDSKVVFVPSRDTPESFSWRSLFGMHGSKSQDDRELGAILLYAYFD